jgi:hypothetical protein
MRPQGLTRSSKGRSILPGVSRPARLIVLLPLCALLVSCGGHRSVLDAGVSSWHDKPHRISPQEAARSATRAFAEWRREVQARARSSPGHRFHNLPPRELRRRLAALAKAHDFTVVRVEFLRPRQLAPVVVIRTTHYVELARATYSILNQIDPKLRTNDDRTGWRYEGFFFEAQDEHGTPFLGAFNFWRGPHAGGGQWARSDPLFPFAHA